MATSSKRKKAEHKNAESSAIMTEDKYQNYREDEMMADDDHDASSEDEKEAVEDVLRQVQSESVPGSGALFGSSSTPSSYSQQAQPVVTSSSFDYYVQPQQASQTYDQSFVTDTLARRSSKSSSVSTTDSKALSAESEEEFPGFTWEPEPTSTRDIASSAVQKPIVVDRSLSREKLKGEKTEDKKGGTKESKKKLASPRSDKKDKDKTDKKQVKEKEKKTDEGKTNKPAKDVSMPKSRAPSGQPKSAPMGQSFAPPARKAPHVLPPEPLKQAVPASPGGSPPPPPLGGQAERGQQMTGYGYMAPKPTSSPSSSPRMSHSSLRSSSVARPVEDPVIKQITSAQRPLDRIVLAQAANGSFVIEHIAAALGVDVTRVKQALPAFLAALENSLLLWATAVALSYLENREANSRDEWDLIGGKAKKYLTRTLAATPQLVEQILAEANKFVATI